MSTNESGPRTDAGRALLVLAAYDGIALVTADTLCDRILAIEAEAAAAPPRAPQTISVEWHADGTVTQRDVPLHRVEARSAGAAPLDVALIGELVNALEWCNARYRQALASTPIRDAEEMREYIRSTLTAARARLSEGTDR